MYFQLSTSPQFLAPKKQSCILKSYAPKGLNIEAGQTNDKNVSFVNCRGFESIYQEGKSTALSAAHLIISFYDIKTENVFLPIADRS